MMRATCWRFLRLFSGRSVARDTSRTHNRNAIVIRVIRPLLNGQGLQESQGLSDQFVAAEPTDGGQHMRGVGAQSPAPFEQPRRHQAVDHHRV